MIRYQITSRNPSSHYFEVSIRIGKPDSKGQHLRLPNWIPGSYMIRDFARNLLDLRASDENGELVLRQIDKSNWQVAAAKGELTIEYKVRSSHHSGTPFYCFLRDINPASEKLIK